MRRPSNPLLAAIAIAVTVVLVLVTSYVVARTPRDVIHAEAIPVASPAPAGDTVAYTVAADRSASDIGADLEGLGIIRSGKQFQVLVAVMGVEGRLSAGDHLLRKGISAAEAVDALTVRSGDQPGIRVTFPEGIRLEEMAVLAEKAGFGTADAFLQAVATAKPPPEIAASLPEGASLQGYLFPDTYILPQGSTPDKLVNLMLQTFLTRVTPDIREAIVARGLTLHQGVTLASIVEREAVLAEERPLIAGVFFNRLAQGDMLGADPTVQYVVALDPESVARYGWWKQELTDEDIHNPSPYNTRQNAGIPPGPITNPGLAAIEAVAHPADTDFYYFVADAKKADGSHRFAVTFEEHEQNIAEVSDP